MSRGLALTTVLLALGLLAYWLFRSSGSEGLPVTQTREPALNPTAVGETPEPAELRQPRKEDPLPAPEQPPPTGRAAPQPKKPEPNQLQLDIRSQANGDVIAAVELWIEDQGLINKRSPTRGDAQVESLPPTIAGLELVARGFLPKRLQREALDDALTASVLRSALSPAVEATGVSFVALQPNGLPATDLQVSSFVRPLLETEGERLLWERQASHAEGVFTLPDLEPGHYRFRLVALDQNGFPKPFLPFEHKLSYYGAEDVRTSVNLRAGALMRLQVLGTQRQPLGRDVAMRLENGRGEVVSTRWLAVVDKQRLLAIDTLPAPSPCLLAESIPPGRYTLRIQAQGQQVDRQLDLPANEITEITIRF